MTQQYGFELIKETTILEINSKAKVFRHIKTGAEIVSLENDDENKCFGITFVTPPPDDTGLPHIMEHSVLCGSRKYPSKDPFFELVKGSLATFINAMTFSDKTVYPVASQNTKDFYNLVDVYLDAVFHPNITPDTLKQEGWHYDMESADGEMEYKGVVFNEMKGFYSSPDQVLYLETGTSLFPDNLYGANSGGNPQAIP
ncbi:MAG: insulinase family protein, partial [Anaerolineae bacterium]|nr:insulinase family protein [Anaerolineae bacterium]